MVKVPRDQRADIVLMHANDILYWLLANNPPNVGKLYWTQDQWDHCNEVREAIKKMATAKARAVRTA